MAIVFQCECGKQLRTGEEYAGRRIKCPGCQSIQIVPASTAGRPAAPDPRPSSGLVRFTCDCGKVMQAQSEYAGKRTKCPACGETVLIPGSRSSDAYTERPARAGRRPADEDEDERDRDWDEGQDRPRRRAARRKAKRSVWPWIAVAAGVLLLVGGVGAWLLFFRGSKMPPDLALVPRDAVGFISVRVADLWNGEAGKEFQQALPDKTFLQEIEKKFGMTPGDFERVTFVMPTDDPKGSWVVVLANKDFEKGKLKEALGSDAKEEKVKDKSYYTSAAGNSALHLVSPKICIFGAPAAVKQYVEGTKPPATSGPLEDGLATAADGEHHIVAAFRMPDRFKNMQGGGMGRPGMMAAQNPALALQAATATAKIGSEVKIDLRLNFSDSDKAALVKQLIDKQLPQLKSGAGFFLQGAVGQGEEGAALLKVIQEALKNLTVEQSGATIRIAVYFKVDLAQLAKAAVPALLKAQQAAGRRESQNNLRQLGLAMHNFHERYRRLPQGRAGAGLSWRVAILPYIGQEALHKQFHLSEPWDSPHNKSLLPQMPKVFAPPPGVKTKQPYSTFYQVFTGPTTPFRTGRDTRITDIQDGTSFTFLIVEAGEAVPWTKPEDLVYDPARPIPPLGGVFHGGFNAALADASVFWFDRAKLSNKTIRGAITIAGHEILGPDWFMSRSN
jgi:hypothetical protein